MRKALALIALATVIAGCQTTDPHPQPVDYSKMTKCEQVANFLSNPWGTPAQQAVAIEVGRNNGCFGEAPEKRYRVTIQ